MSGYRKQYYYLTLQNKKALRDAAEAKHPRSKEKQLPQPPQTQIVPVTDSVKDTIIEFKGKFKLPSYRVMTLLVGLLIVSYLFSVVKSNLSQINSNINQLRNMVDTETAELNEKLRELAVPWYMNLFYKFMDI